MMPFDWPHGRLARAGRRGAVRDAAAGRSRRARDQDRAARHRRLRARLRHDRQGPVELLRVAESIEGVADARSEDSRARRRFSTRCSRAPTCSSRTSRPGAADRLGTAPRRAARALSAAHRLLGLRLRLVGPVCRSQGVRPARAERGRAAVAHGHDGDAGQGRHFGRGHRRRHVRVLGHPDGALRARDVRPRCRRRGVALRRAGRMDERAGGVHAATADPRRRAPAPHHASIAPYGPCRRPKDGDAVYVGDSECARVDAVLRGRAAATGARD